MAEECGSPGRAQRMIEGDHAIGCIARAFGREVRHQHARLLERITERSGKKISGATGGVGFLMSRLSHRAMTTHGADQQQALSEFDSSRSFSIPGLKFQLHDATGGLKDKSPTGVRLTGFP